MLKFSGLKLRGELQLNLTALPTIWWVSPKKTLGPYGSDLKPSKDVDVTFVASTTTGLAIRYNFVGGGLPGGTTLDPQTGNLSGTITDGDGVYNFTITAESGNLTATKNFKLVVGNAPPPEWITPPGVLNMYETGDLVPGIALLAEDVNDLPVFYTVVGGSLPLGLTMNTTTGIISGTISQNIETDTLYNFTVAATNGSASVNRAFQIYVFVRPPENAPHWITPIGQIGNAVIETMPFDFQLEAVDPNSLPIQYVQVAGVFPVGIGVNSNTGVVSGSAPFVTNDTTFTVIMGARTDNYTTKRLFKIKVLFDFVPVFGSDSGDGTFNAGTYLELATIENTAIQASPSLLPLTYYSNTLEIVSNGTLHYDANGILYGSMPNAIIDGDFHQPLVFDVTVSDGVKSASLSVTITNEKNVPPTFVANGNIGTDLGGYPLNTIHPLATDLNGTLLTYILNNPEDLPPSINFDTLTGEFYGTYPPTPDNDIPLTFDITVTDAGVHYVNGSVSLLAWHNTPPVITTPEGLLGNVTSQFGFNYNIDAFDPQEKTIHFAIQGTNPFGADMAIDPSTGHISGMAPYVAQDTDYTFTVVVDDGVLSNTANYTIHVQYDAPPTWDNATTDFGSYLAAIPFSATATASSNNEGQSVRYYVVDDSQLPAGVFFDGQTISGMFPNDPTATYQVTAGVVDLDHAGQDVPGHSIIKTYSITSEYNAAPRWISDYDVPTSHTINNPSVLPVTANATLPEWETTALGNFDGQFAGGEYVELYLYASNATSYYLMPGDDVIPEGLTFDGSYSDDTGNYATLIGNVGVSNATSYSFTVVAQNDSGNAAQTFTANLITTMVIIDGFETTEVSAQLFAEDDNNQVINYFYSQSSSIIVQDQQSGFSISIDQGQGIVSGTLPPVGADTHYDFTVQAWDQSAGFTDGFYFKTPKTFRILNRFNFPPVWSNDPPALGKIENTSFTYQMSASGKGNLPSLRYTLDSGELPPYFTLTESGVLSGITNSVDEDTTYSFRVRADNGIKSSTKDFTFTVYDNVPPTWNTPVMTVGNFFSENGNIPWTQFVSASDINSVHAGNPIKYILTDRGNVPTNTVFELADQFYSRVSFYSPFQDTTDPLLGSPFTFSVPTSMDSGLDGTEMDLDGSRWFYRADFIKDSSFTIEFTVKTTLFSLPSPQTILAYGTEFDLTYQNNIFTFTVGAFPQIVSATLEDDAYYTIAITRSGNTFRLFIDGEFVGSTLAANNPTDPIVQYPAANLVFGAYDDTGINVFTGKIRELRTTGAVRYTESAGSNFPMSDVFLSQTSYYSNFEGEIYNYGFANSYTTYGTVSYGSGLIGYQSLNFNNSWISGSADFSDKDFTIEVSVRFANTDDQTIFANGDSSDGFKLKLLGGFLCVENNGDNIIFGITSITTGTWYTIMLSKNFKHFYLIVDDALEGYYRNFDNGSGHVYANTDFFVGADDASGSNNFLGLMDAFRVTNGVSRWLRSYLLPEVSYSQMITGKVIGKFPIEEQDTVYAFSVAATDGKFTIDGTFSMLNLEDTDPFFVTPNGLRVQTIERYPISTSVAAGDIEGQTITYTLDSGTLPPGVVLNSDGTIIGNAPVQPNPDPQFDQYDFVVKASDGFNETTRDFYILVQHDFPPVWSTPQGNIGNVVGGMVFNFPVRASDFNNTNVSYTLTGGSLPPGVLFNNASGSFGGVLDVNANTAFYYPEITISDGNSRIMRQFRIGAIHNDPPASTLPTGTALFTDWEQTIVLADDDDPYIITVADPNGIKVTADVTMPPFVIYTLDTSRQDEGIANIVITNVTYPAVDMDRVFTMTVVSSDDVLDTTFNYYFNVKWNSPPVWVTNPNLGTKQESSLFVANVVATSNGLPVFYSIESTDMPDVSIDAGTGTITWTTPPVFDDTVFHIRIVASTGIKFTPQDFTITVVRNLPPIWITQKDLGVVNENTVVTFVLAAYDPNNSYLTYQQTGGTIPAWLIPDYSTFGTAPAYNTVTLSGTVPFVLANSNVAFTMGADDGFQLVEQDFMFKIFYDPPPVWITGNTIGTYNANTVANFHLNAVDNHGTVTYTNTTALPSGVKLVQANGLLYGTWPDVSSDTTYNLTFNALDDHLRANTQVFSLNIISTYDPDPYAASVVTFMNFEQGNGTIPKELSNANSVVTQYQSSGSSAVISGTQVRFQNGAGAFQASNFLRVSPSVPMKGDFTIEMFVYAMGIGSILYNGFPSSVGNTESMALQIRGSSAASNLTLYSKNTDKITAALGTFSWNTWHHVALTRSGGTTKMWLDGIQYGSSTTAFTGTSGVGGVDGFWTVGGYNGDPAQGMFNGYIDNLRITNGVVRYTGAFTPPTKPFDPSGMPNR